MTTYVILKNPNIKKHLQNEYNTNEEVIVTERLDFNCLKKGDIVIGNLRINTIAEICRLGCAYYNLRVNSDAEIDFETLSLEEMALHGVAFEQFKVFKNDNPTSDELEIFPWSENQQDFLMGVFPEEKFKMGINFSHKGLTVKMSSPQSKSEQHLKIRADISGKWVITQN